MGIARRHPMILMNAGAILLTGKLTWITDPHHLHDWIEAKNVWRQLSLPVVLPQLKMLPKM